MKEIFVAGRVLLGSYFLFSATHHFTGTAAMAHQVAMKGVPMPEAAVIGAGLLLAIGGISLILGLMPKVGIAALVLFLVPVTLMMHQFWKAAGPERMAQTINFTKNVGLLGSILMLVGVPEPWPFSVANRGYLSRRGRLETVHHHS
jgi:putative oxidoreductase